MIKEFFKNFGFEFSTMSFRNLVQISGWLIELKLSVSRDSSFHKISNNKKEGGVLSILKDTFPTVEKLT